MLVAEAQEVVVVEVMVASQQVEGAESQTDLAVLVGLDAGAEDFAIEDSGRDALVGEALQQGFDPGQREREPVAIGLFRFRFAAAYGFRTGHPLQVAAVVEDVADAAVGAVDLLGSDHLLALLEDGGVAAQVLDFGVRREARIGAFGVAGGGLDRRVEFDRTIAVGDVLAGYHAGFGRDDEPERGLAAQAHAMDQLDAVAVDIGLLRHITRDAQTVRDFERQHGARLEIDHFTTGLIQVLFDTHLPTADDGEFERVGIGVGADLVDPRNYDFDGAHG